MDEGAILFLLLILGFFIVVAPIITWVICSGLRKNFEALCEEVRILRSQLMSMRKHMLDDTAPSVKTEEAPQPLPVLEKVAEPPPLPPAVQAPKATVDMSAQVQAAFERRSDSTSGQDTPPRPQLAPAPPAEPSEWERAAKEALMKVWNWLIVGEEHRKPGVPMEYAVATNWLVRVGVLIMVVGMAFFLDYTAEQGWLGPMGQVSIAMLAGAGIMAAGIRLLDKKYHLLAQGFLGAGLGIWYVAIYAGHIQYALFGPTLTFVIMVAITASAAFMALRFRSLLVAVLGILGGYGTPFMLPGAGNLVGLYGYLLILGIGVLAVAHRRNWHLLNFLAFVLTSALVTLTVTKQGSAVNVWQVIPFVTAYFVLFSTVIFIYHVLHRKRTTALELVFLILNAAYTFGMFRHLILLRCSSETLAIVSVLMAVFYMAHLYVFLSRKGHDRGLAVSFSGLAAFFLIITLPLLFSDAWLTVSWSVMALVLLWSSQRMESRFVETVSVGLFAWVALRFLGWDLSQSFWPDNQGSLSGSAYLLALGERLITFGVPIACFGGALRLLTHADRKEPSVMSLRNDIPFRVKTSVFHWLLGTLVFLMALGYVQLELARTLDWCAPALLPPVLTSGWVVAAAVLLYLHHRFRHPLLLNLMVVFVCIILAKLLLFDLPGWGVLFGRYLFDPRYGYSFLDAGMRLLDFGLVLAFFTWLYGYFSRSSRSTDLRNFFGYGALALLLLYTTLEVNSVLSAFVPGLRAGGISVFWGLFALGLVTGGLFKRLRSLRILGLALFSLVALKVFLSDLVLLDPVYKIVAFILLGVVLIAGAYAYLRFEDRFQTPEDSV
jgi:uncharacterized membrane protein